MVLECGDVFYKGGRVQVVLRILLHAFSDNQEMAFPVTCDVCTQY